MRKLALICILGLAAFTSTASAAGLNLHWDNCVAGGGVQNTSFACDDNTRTFPLVGQFRIPKALISVVSVECSVSLATASATLPAWWQNFAPGVCRSGWLSAGFAALPGCPFWGSGGTGGGGIEKYDSILGPNTLRIIPAFGAAPPPRDLTDLAADYLCFDLVISSANTTIGGSTGSGCPGCDAPACIVFNTCTVTQLLQDTDGIFRGVEFKITGPQSPGSDFVTWQGGQGVVTLQGAGCPAATPTRSSTWGGVKSLYR